jgi:hypothetical protein
LAFNFKHQDVLLKADEVFKKPLQLYSFAVSCRNFIVKPLRMRYFELPEVMKVLCILSYI